MARTLRASAVYFAVALLLVAAACDGDTSERYVITETAPFYQIELPYNPEHMNAAISVVRSFADRNEMDFLLAQRSLPPGEFNASADGPLLNLSVIHLNEFGDRMRVFAYVRGAPTAQDWSATRSFVAELEASQNGTH